MKNFLPNVHKKLTIVTLEEYPKIFYRENQEKWLVVYYIQFLFILLLSTCSVAEEAAFDKKDFFITLSIDKNITSSQNASSNVAFSAISSLAYLSNKFKLNENVLYRLSLGYAAAMVTILNHELSGHGLRGLELNCRITNLEIGFSIFSGTLYNSCPIPRHVQTDSIISLGGMQANYLLAQKISDNLLFHNQKIDPITGIGYVFSAIDQIYYNYMHVNPNKPGHDLNNHARTMEAMYGDRSMNLDIIKSNGFLSLLDPILFASIYSVITGRSISAPVLGVGSTGIMPFARSVITPYGVIEKKFGLYVLTDYTPVKVGFSFGKQLKTNKPKNLDTFEKYSYFGMFTGLQKGEVVAKYITYSFDISVFRLFSFDKLNIGANAIFWRQPELFAKDPYREKPKNGFMFTVNTRYEVSKDINILCDIGYKSKGFVPGQYLNETLIASLAFEYKL